MKKLIKKEYRKITSGINCCWFEPNGKVCRKLADWEKNDDELMSEFDEDEDEENE